MQSVQEKQERTYIENGLRRRHSAKLVDPAVFAISVDDLEFIRWIESKHSETKKSSAQIVKHYLCEAFKRGLLQQVELCDK